MTQINGNALDECPLTEPFPAPEIYVDGYQTSSIANGTAKFSFFTLSYDPATNRQTRRVCLRLTATLPVVMGIHAALGSLLEQLDRMTPEGDIPGERPVAQ